MMINNYQITIFLFSSQFIFAWSTVKALSLLLTKFFFLNWKRARLWERRDILGLIYFSDVRSKRWNSLIIPWLQFQSKWRWFFCSIYSINIMSLSWTEHCIISRSREFKIGSRNHKNSSFHTIQVLILSFTFQLFLNELITFLSFLNTIYYYLQVEEVECKLHCEEWSQK